MAWCKPRLGTRMCLPDFTELKWVVDTFDAIQVWVNRWQVVPEKGGRMGQRPAGQEQLAQLVHGRAVQHGREHEQGAGCDSHMSVEGIRWAASGPPLDGAVTVPRVVVPPTPAHMSSSNSVFTKAVSVRGRVL